MTLRVSGKNLAIGVALRTHVHSRIDGVVAKYHAGRPTGHVRIDAQAEEAMALPPLSDIEDEVEEEAGESFPAVVAEHATGVEEMTVAAAVAKLDITDCPVIVFRYAENRRINFVYRRADGNIGWIDPLGVTNGHGS